MSVDFERFFAVALRFIRVGPLVIALLLTSVTGCGAGHLETANASSDGVSALAAPADASALYSTEVTSGPFVRGPLAETAADAIRRAVDAAATQADMPLEGDPRLAALAAWTLSALADDGSPPSSAAIDFGARTLGLVEPVPHILVVGRELRELPDAVTSQLSAAAESQRYNRWGAAVAERNGLSVAVLMLSWRWVELTPVARQTQPGAPLRVQGRFVAEHRNPRVAVTRPDGEVRRLPAGAGPSFDVRLPTDAVGAYRVEILGLGDRGDAVIANFPVYVGIEPPTSLRLAADHVGVERDADAVQSELLAQINDMRRREGLPPVSESRELASVALAHSRDMVRNDFIGHTSPTTGNAADRVRSARVTTGLVLENIGRGYSAAEIHRGLVDSPGHRANLQNADVSHVGIGVVAQPEGERVAFVVTQVFARLAAEVDLTNASQRILEGVNQARRARGAPPLEAVDHLAEAAQEAVSAFFADPSLSQQDAVDDASAGLRRFAIAYRRLGGVMAQVVELEEAMALEPTLDPEVRYVGIGVALGSRDDTTQRSLAVVFMLAWPR